MAKNYDFKMQTMSVKTECIKGKWRVVKIENFLNQNFRTVLPEIFNTKKEAEEYINVFLPTL